MCKFCGSEQMLLDKSTHSVYCRICGKPLRPPMSSFVVVLIWSAACVLLGAMLMM